MVVPARGDIYLVNLDPTVGREIRKAKPCVVVSPNELNAHLATFIIAPLTTGSHPYPFRIACKVAGKAGHIVLDQVRTVDRRRLVRRVGRLPSGAMSSTLTVLQEMFAP